MAKEIPMRLQDIETLVSFLPPETAILMKGDHAKGKSEFVYQLAEKLGAELSEVRVGQVDSGDLIGYPYKGEDGKMHYSKPWWFPELYPAVKAGEIDPRTGKTSSVDIPADDHNKKFLVFLDEVNRPANPETLQAIFQFVLGNRLHEHIAPPNTYRVACINSDTEKYQVVDLDNALTSRFVHINFNPSHQEWLDYAKSQNINEFILEFCTMNKKYIDPPQKLVDNEKYQDRRMWFHLNKWLKNAEKKNSKIITDSGIMSAVASSFLGSECGLIFANYICDAMKQKIARSTTNINTINDEEQLLKKLVEISTNGFNKDGIFTENKNKNLKEFTESFYSISIEAKARYIDMILQDIESLERVTNDDSRLRLYAYEAIQEKILSGYPELANKFYHDLFTNPNKVKQPIKSELQWNMKIKKYDGVNGVISATGTNGNSNNISINGSLNKKSLA